MIEKERKLALHCLKANSDYHSEICEECIKYPCSHRIQDDVTETIIKELEREFNTQLTTEHIIKSTIKEYIDKPHDDVTELLLALNKDLCERIRKESENGTY